MNQAEGRGGDGKSPWSLHFLLRPDLWPLGPCHPGKGKCWHLKSSRWKFWDWNSWVLQSVYRHDGVRWGPQGLGEPAAAGECPQQAAWGLRAGQEGPLAGSGSEGWRGREHLNSGPEGVRAAGSREKKAGV